MFLLFVPAQATGLSPTVQKFVSSRVKSQAPTQIEIEAQNANGVVHDQVKILLGELNMNGPNKTLADTALEGKVVKNGKKSEPQNPFSNQAIKSFKSGQGQSGALTYAGMLEFNEKKGTVKIGKNDASDITNNIYNSAELKQLAKSDPKYNTLRAKNLADKALGDLTYDIFKLQRGKGNKKPELVKSRLKAALKALTYIKQPKKGQELDEASKAYLTHTLVLIEAIRTKAGVTLDDKSANNYTKLKSFVEKDPSIKVEELVKDLNKEIEAIFPNQSQAAGSDGAAVKPPGGITPQQAAQAAAHPQ